MAAVNSPAQLGADNVIRFVDVAHFLRELTGHLGRGRAFVRTRRKFELRSSIDVKIEAPGIGRRVSARGFVVFNRDGFLGLEFEDFETRLARELDDLGRAAETGLDGSGDRMVVSPMPQARSAPGPRDAAPFGPADPRAVTGWVGPMEDAHIRVAATGQRRPGDLSPSAPTTAQAQPHWNPTPARLRRRQPADGVPNAAPRPLTDDLQADLGMAAVSPPTESGFVSHPETQETEPPPGLKAMLDQSRWSDAPSMAPVVAPLNVMNSDAGPPSLDLELPDDDEPEPAAATRPGIPIIAEGVESLSKPGLNLPRMTPAGVLRMTDPADLLGLYLAGIRHGTMTVFGGPSAMPGDVLTIKISAHRVIELSTVVVARCGLWLTMTVHDSSPLVALLRETSDAFGAALAEIGVAAGSVAVSASDRGSASVESNDTVFLDPQQPTPPLRASAPRAQLGLTGAPTETTEQRGGTTGDLVDAIVAASPSESLPEHRASVGPTSSAEASSGAVAADASPSTAGPRSDAGRSEVSPPGGTNSDDVATVPHLDGSLVVFDNAASLAQELQVNLQNGGLFVAAEPLEIRSKRELRIKVGEELLPTILETDVVFASGGRVGFSVANAQSARQDLQRYLDGDLPLDAPARSSSATRGPQTGGLDTFDVDNLNADAVRSADVHTFAGRIDNAPSDPDLLELQETRIEDPSALGVVSVLHLFEYVVRKQWKGVLTVRHEEASRKVWMHEGSVAYIQSSPYEESTSLGRILVMSKKLTEVNLRDGLEKSKQSNRSLGRSLVLLGMVKRSDITAALREQVRLKMDACFSWSDGTYEWTPWTEPPGEADLVLTRGIGVMARHARGRLDHVNISELERLYGRNLSRTVAHATDVDTVATSLQLAPRDLRFLELQVDGTRTVQDAVMGSPMGRLASLRLIGLGLALGFVRYTDAPKPRERRASTSSDGASPIERKLKKQLQEDLQLLQSQNHFERLGVHWSAHHRTYRAAYDAALAQVDAKKPPLRDASDESKGLARKIRAELEQSFKVLDDAQQRAQYRKTLFDATEREYASDMLVKQGEVALMRGDRVQAIECFETAAELNASQRNRALLKSARDGRA